ncbi:MAG TPA: hypothetical protein VGH37_03650 [Candidatus Acidoferrum sp.]|jgi:hypothetical protein
MVKLKIKKYTLKPIEEELNTIREGLVEDSKIATGPKKISLLLQIKKLDKLIALLVVTCKHHTMG